MRTLKALVTCSVVLLGLPIPSTASAEPKEMVYHYANYDRGEYCLSMNDVFGGSSQPLKACYQDNNRSNVGPRGAGFPCVLEMLACQAKQGHLVVGGWDHLYGDGLAYGIAPNRYLANVERTSSYLAPFSTVDQTFVAEADVYGGFASSYGPYTKICLEVYDWGLAQPGRVYVQKTLITLDCIRPADTIRQLRVTGSIAANHQAWVVASLHNETGVGAATFFVAVMGHDII